MAAILLTGRPGIGKTTVVERLTEQLMEAGVSVAGFWTTEVREDGSRVGFDLVLAPRSRDDQHPDRVRLARVGLDSDVTVGRYGVDVQAVVEHGIPALEAAADVVVLDEIAPMELAAPGFEDAVVALLDVDRPLVATVHRSSQGFAGDMKRRSDVEVIEVTRENRDVLPDRVSDRLA